MEITINRPLLIAFIGIDGMGKSTQIQNFRSWIVQFTKREVIVKKMDGPGNQVIQELAKMMFGDPHRYHPGIDPDIRAIACSVDTSAYFLNTVRGELNAGKVVISDRYVHCQYAYFRAYDTDMYWPEKIMSMVRAPDITFLLDGPPEEVRGRLNNRGEGSNERESNLPEQKRVRQEYLNLVSEFKNTIVINSLQSEEDVADDIKSEFLSWWRQEMVFNNPDSGKS